MKNERWYQIALTLIPGLGPTLRNRLVRHFGSAAAIFNVGIKELCEVEGIHEKGAALILSWNDHKRIEKELQFIGQQNITPVFITDDDYPKRLLNCADPPTLLYWKGNANLNVPKVVSIIGTRICSSYGKQVTEKIIAAMPADMLIVSGLAWGIDAIAHKTALEKGLQTVGILGHGMDIIYPSKHQSLANSMQKNGGILTEFKQETPVHKHNFPKRNRIVAGMADATIVIETAVKGGSMITADLAFHYNRELFAVPGRINDAKSAGCLQLIQENKAIVFNDTDHFLETMGWDKPNHTAPVQGILIETLSQEEQRILQQIKNEEAPAIESLKQSTGLNSSRLAAALLNLELQGFIQVLPGNRIERL